MGVRGTHYEVELVGKEMFVAVWEGIVDVNTSVGSRTQFSLGPTLDYRFAVVDTAGDVSFLLDEPDVFGEGHSKVDESSNDENTEESATVANNAVETTSQEPNLVDNASEIIEIQVEQSLAETGESVFDNERLIADIQPDVMDTNTRSGSVTFNQVSENSLMSSSGDISDVNISLTLDFDTARVPTGNLSITDPGGEWFAVFNGVFNQDGLDLNINFASHGNNLAQGEIGGLLVDDSTAILGQLSLSEIENSQTQIEGAFLITE